MPKIRVHTPHGGKFITSRGSVVLTPDPDQAGYSISGELDPATVAEMSKFTGVEIVKEDAPGASADQCLTGEQQVTPDEQAAVDAEVNAEADAYAKMTPQEKRAYANAKKAAAANKAPDGTVVDPAKE